MIRLLEQSDIAPCCAIVQQHWDEQNAKRAKKQLKDAFHDSPNKSTYFVYDDQGILGFAGVRPSFIFRGAFEIPWIAVHSQAQGKGLGATLMDACFGEVGRRHGALMLLMTEKPAFFARFGFETAKAFDGWELMTLKLHKLTLGPLITP